MSAGAVSTGTTVAAERLLEAWRGEVEAEAVYSVLAARETDKGRRGVRITYAVGLLVR
jgi:hypothetical protein